MPGSCPGRYGLRRSSIARLDLLLLEAVEWSPRLRPWVLPSEVAFALGRAFAASADGGDRGMAHGDFAPWNLLRTSDGWVLVDWERLPRRCATLLRCVPLPGTGRRPAPQAAGASPHGGGGPARPGSGPHSAPTREGAGRPPSDMAAASERLLEAQHGETRSIRSGTGDRAGRPTATAAIDRSMIFTRTLRFR